MIPTFIKKEQLLQIINNAIQEDLGEGDHSSLAVIPATQTGKAFLIAKENGIIAGLELAEIIFKQFNAALKLKMFYADGDPVHIGDKIFYVEGPAREILSAERLVLNFMQRMSGIATKTNNLSKIIKRYNVKLLDTRKTTPTIRCIEKWAVLIGGGYNHRIGLFDMIMLKDNHIDSAGGISNAIASARQYLEKTKKNLKIEIETRNLDEVREVIETGGVDIIMFDNMSTENIKKGVILVNGKYKTEASGNIDESNIADYAVCGVDYISSGALTHTVKSLDLSLKIIINK